MCSDTSPKDAVSLTIDVFHERPIVTEGTIVEKLETEVKLDIGNTSQKVQWLPMKRTR